MCYNYKFMLIIIGNKGAPSLKNITRWLRDWRRKLALGCSLYQKKAPLPDGPTSLLFFLSLCLLLLTYIYCYSLHTAEWKTLLPKKTRLCLFIIIIIKFFFFA